MDSNYFYVYKVTNKINGKIYIGKSKFRPYYNNYYGSGVMIKEAIHKYGRENFEKEILETFENEEEAYLAEIKYIEEYDSTNHNIGYNIDKGGKGDILKSYKGQLKHWQDLLINEDKANKITSKMGSEEYREKQRNITQNIWNNMSSEEYKNRCDLAKNIWTPELRERKSEQMKNISDEYRKKISEGVNKANKDPEVIKRRKEAMNNPELKKHLAECRKKQAQDPWYKEFNRKVSQPLSQVTRLLKANKISEEEAKEMRRKLYLLKDEMYSKRNLNVKDN